MVFTSVEFVLFFCVFLALLAAQRSRARRYLVILLGSVVFYAAWDYRFVVVLLAPGLVDYWCATRIEASKGGRRKAWLVCSLCFNLGLLGYFKYFNFFVENIAALTGVAPRHFDIVLPVGISFFTFKTMSYTIDVYRSEVAACRSLRKYLTFIFYFPEIVAGPIVRAAVLLPQFSRSLRPSRWRLMFGLQIVLLGFTKKLLVADHLAVFVDQVFAQSAEFDSLTLALAVLAYAIQIYCDFSGYSDIAVGVSKIIGLDLPENFNMPYLATSVSDFWRRWNMTLSSWLRDYLYIPLGGNRRGAWRTFRNLLITMLLGGLWHGAQWTFVVWGGLHGLFLVIQRLWGRLRVPATRPVRLLYWMATFTAVNIAWVFFRAQDFGTATLILERIARGDAPGFRWLYSPLLLLICVVVAGHWVGRLAGRRSPPSRGLARVFERAEWLCVVRPYPGSGAYVMLEPRTFIGAFAITIWLIALALFAALSTSPFIYFQF
jgi:alginate O-acetyltransferase complex protein AlgI